MVGEDWKVNDKEIKGKEFPLEQLGEILNAQVRLESDSTGRIQKDK